MQVSQIFVYPVKSLRGIAVEKAELTPLGLRYDRHWMVIDDKNKFVTMRKHPQMTLIQTQVTSEHLVLSAKGLPDFLVPLSSPSLGDAPPIELKATIWNDECVVLDEGERVSEWLTHALQSRRTLRLVRMANNSQRPQSKPERFGDSTTQFADACAYLLCNQSSLDVLNEFLMEQCFSPVPMQRFRPNIVINSTAFPAFAEHQKIGEFLHHPDYQFQLRDPCQRCIVPNIDIETGDKNEQQQPYKSLVTLNPMPDNPKAAAFGQNMTLHNGIGAIIQVGDTLTLN